VCLLLLNVVNNAAAKVTRVAGLRTAACLAAPARLNQAVDSCQEYTVAQPVGRGPAPYGPTACSLDSNRLG
jgi:hypothetical protein